MRCLLRLRYSTLLYYSSIWLYIISTFTTNTFTQNQTKMCSASIQFKCIKPVWHESGCRGRVSPSKRPRQTDDICGTKSKKRWWISRLGSKLPVWLPLSLLYFTLLVSTFLNHGSTSLYTLLYHGSISLYFILLPPTMVLLHSIWFYTPQP